jgi:PAS domain S-box-containing protein
MSRKHAKPAVNRRRASRPRRAIDAEKVPTRDGDGARRDLEQKNQELYSQLGALRDDQKSLEQARAEYADLFDFAPVTYALLDATGIVLKANLAACRLLDVEREHLIGHPLFTFVLQRDRPEFLEHLRRCRTGPGMVESEIRFSAPRSRLLTCRLYSKRTSYDERDAFPTVIIDQTEFLALDDARLIAERGKEQAERASEIAHADSSAKDRFLATVSHELRTPLTPALFAASRLASWEALPRTARKLGATIKRNIEFEARLIDDLLDVARINRGRMSLQLDTVDVHEVLRQALEICSPFAGEKAVTVTAHLAAEAHHVNGDRGRLRQVFWNVLNNAIKFSEAGGSVVVRSVNEPEAVLRVSVRDSGVGIDATEIEKLFAPFDRRPVDKESRMGLGLGLSICKGIVAAHGGQIWAMSDGPGRGATFAVELATAAEQAEEIEDGAPAVAVEGTREAQRLRVLVIEDDADSSQMLALFLSEHGHDVEVASSLRVAIGRLDEHWDVVLSDIGLPDGSGLEVARHARRMVQPPQRLIAFSGYGSDDDITASREAGFDEHVVKPIDLDQLLSTLSGALARQPEYR